MEKPSSENLRDIVPVWMKTAIVALWAFSGIVGTWRHVMTRWDWLVFVSVLGLISFPSAVKEPLGKNLRWPWRVAFLLWVIAFSAWFAHVWGWIPALAFAALSFVRPSWDRSGTWKAALQKPQNIASALLSFILIMWFARTTGAWVPTACVVATFLLLEGYAPDGRTLARRSLGDNLRRRPSAVIAAIAIFAAVWARLHQSFGNVVGLVIVIILFLADIYLHTEEKPSFHPSQPQS